MTALSLEDEKVETLTRLGLTVCQARVYLTLARLGMATARAISEASNMVRPDIYRIMPTLQELGLAEKTITTPTRFKATPIEDAVFFLLQNRIKETSELQEKARELVEYVAEKKTETAVRENQPQFVLIPEKEAVAKKRKNATEKAQTSIDVVTSWSRLSAIMLTYGEELKKALKRGVRIRHISEKPADKESLAQAKEIMQTFKKYPSFEVKYSRTPITTVVSVIDKKEVLMFASPTREIDGSPALLSTNPSLIELAQHYFDMMWNTALEKLPEEP